MERIKLIWDFKGPNAAPIAKHHVIHLEEFAVSEGLENAICKTEAINPNHQIAYMIVDEKHMKHLRETLKPNRGQRYTEK